MSRFICLITLLLFTVSMPVFSKDKNSSLGDIIDDVLDDDNDHPGQGKGRPDNPGEHGRDNAAEKQSRGHGKGSKGDESWIDKIEDELEDDDKGKSNKKDKGKKK